MQRGEHKVRDFSCLDQFFAMAFAQLKYRESLRDIEGNLRAQAHCAASRSSTLMSDCFWPIAAFETKRNFMSLNRLP